MAIMTAIQENEKVIIYDEVTKKESFRVEGELQGYTGKYIAVINGSIYSVYSSDTKKVVLTIDTKLIDDASADMEFSEDINKLPVSIITAIQHNDEVIVYDENTQKEAYRVEGFLHGYTNKYVTVMNGKIINAYFNANESIRLV